MAFEIDALTLPGIFVVTYQGTVTTQERSCAVEAWSEWSLQPGANGVLLDFTQATVVHGSLEERVDLAKKLASQYRHLPSMRIAYVANLDNDDPVTVEGLAASRGFFFERFTSRASATRWLLGMQPAAPTGPRERRSVKR
jgi:hypothetical protein